MRDLARSAIITHSENKRSVPTANHFVYAITESFCSLKMDINIGRFDTRDVLPVWSSFGKNFVVLLVMRLQYIKDGRKKRNTSRRAFFRYPSFQTHFEK